MSIATSVTVRPSRRLQLLMLLMMIALVVVGLQLLRLPAAGERLVLHQLLSVVCGAAALLLFSAARRLSKVVVIDISGLGVIRLHHTGRVADATPVSVSDHQHSDAVVQLMKDSTLWSSLLLLRLRSATGRVFVVPVLPDAVCADAFRSLSLACRWIATQAASDPLQRPGPRHD